MGRLAAMLLAPLLAFGALELALRAAGYGYPTSFFVRTRIDGRDFYMPNPKFGFRFFPPALARTPLPIRMPAEKSTNSYRIFLFGESAAYGDPDSSYGVGRYLEVLLRERFPETRFEVVCVAMTAINSHAILPIARECARRDGDLWIIYMGNNEMVGPFGAGTVFGPRTPSLAFIRASLALKTIRVGQWMDACVRRLRKDSMPKTWGGLNMFANMRLAYDDPSRLRAYDYFRRNLEDILRAARRAGVPVLLSTMAVNLKDCAPFGSLHRPGLDAADESAWQTLYQAGVALESAGSLEQALDRYQKAAEIDPQFAELQFRLGACYLAMTNSAEARPAFELARDYDAMPIRADARINQIIRKAACRHAEDGVHFVDAVEALAQHSAGGIAGDELFYEHVHLNLEGNYRLARAFAEQVARLLPEPIASRGRDEWASAQTCERRLAVTVWDRYRLWQVIGARLQQPPYTEQSNHAARLRKHEAEADDLRSRLKTESAEQAAEMYRQAIARSPEDNLLRANYSQFLFAGGRLTEALEEAERARALLPEVPGPYYYMGTLLVRAGRSREAAEYFSRAIALRSDFVEALNELGLVRQHEHKPAEAARWFERARRADPTRVETHLNLGFLAQTEGKMEEAMAQYRQAARLQPRGPADYFSQAVALAAQGRHVEAGKLFRTLLQYKPDLWQAHYLLAAELAAQGKPEEAGRHYSEAIRYRPDFASAHAGYAATLARLGRTDEAEAEFQKALQLDPTNATAQRHAGSSRR